jgi:hypothetical protein
MPPLISEWTRSVDRDGFAILPQVFAPHQVDQIVHDLADLLDGGHQQNSAIRGRDGIIYAARNVLEWWPGAKTVCEQIPIPPALKAILGAKYGLVRALYFDKPPERSWALPWHKDLTIAVRDNTLPSTHFRKPTRKADVPHVEAPVEVLQSILTVRVHLDEVTEENGPVRVLPGSHNSGKTLQIEEAKAVTILVNRGDVLLIRPLVAHSSTNSHPETLRHRRILHFEFAARAWLPDCYEWHCFHRGRQ